MNITLIIFEFLILIFSAVLHEVAHGYAAKHLGDDTAERAGRLTLNPLRHLDPFYSVLMPILLFIGTGGSFFFAAAKPVPFDPRKLKDARWGSAKVALAGPATNLLLAIVFGIAVRIFVLTTVSDMFITLLAIVVLMNIVLGLFNLIPIPPLDGSRVLFALLPQTQATYRIMYMLERWGLVLVLIFAFWGFQLIRPAIGWLFTLFTGQNLAL